MHAYFKQSRQLAALVLLGLSAGYMSLATARLLSQQAVATHDFATLRGTKVVLAGVGPGGAKIAPGDFRNYLRIIAIPLPGLNPLGALRRLSVVQTDIARSQRRIAMVAFGSDPVRCSGLQASGALTVICYGEAGSMHEVAEAAGKAQVLILNREGEILSRVTVGDLLGGRANRLAAKLASASGL